MTVWMRIWPRPVADYTVVRPKTRDLMLPVLGRDKANELIDQVNALEKVKDMRSLQPLWTA